jgi:SAM-dependent methyltransferase
MTSDRMLLPDDVLARSSVVANCAMNRERQLAGPNSYERELGFNPVDRLTRILAESPASAVAWLDLCCGTGRALTQAAQRLADEGLAGRAHIVGVDLVGYFDPVPATDLPLDLICDSVTSWTPSQRFDLITCIHGLHYVGDKLATLVRAASWLKHDGQLIADLDLASIRLPDGAPAGRALAMALRQAGFICDVRRHRITRTGYAKVALPYMYLGADDTAAPNYTGQPAVVSIYQAR